MVYAIVHFTVGFVIVLALLAALPITRYRLTGAYVGGMVALVPDAHRFVGGALGRRILAFHFSPRADAFFFHHALDSVAFRAYNAELALLSFAVLGLAFLVYERRYATSRRAARRISRRTGSDDAAEFER